MYAVEVRTEIRHCGNEEKRHLELELPFLFYRRVEVAFELIALSLCRYNI